MYFISVQKYLKAIMSVNENGTRNTKLILFCALCIPCLYLAIMLFITIEVLAYLMQSEHFLQLEI